MNELVMVDSSCWIRYFRNSDIHLADLLQKLIEMDVVCICSVIELEIVQGIKNSKQAVMIKDLFNALNYFDFVREDFINAANTIKKLRNSGFTAAPSDTLISEICIRNNIPILTFDKDFEHFPNLKKYKTKII